MNRLQKFVFCIVLCAFTASFVYSQPRESTPTVGNYDIYWVETGFIQEIKAKF